MDIEISRLTTTDRTKLQATKTLKDYFRVGQEDGIEKITHKSGDPYVVIHMTDKAVGLIAIPLAQIITMTGIKEAKRGPGRPSK